MAVQCKTYQTAGKLLLFCQLTIQAVRGHTRELQAKKVPAVPRGRMGGGA